MLLIDKPLDWTSFDVVKKVRFTFQTRKVGHAGTLDPKATGLLIVCTGKRTKEIDQFVGLEKEYTGTLELGIRTPSFDSETEVSERGDSSAITDEAIFAAVAQMIGTQLQMPPMYSALKYGGRPLYRYARAGKTVVREPREILVSAFAIEAIRRPYVDFRVVCSKGTYVRTLVDDIGQKLGCGASLSALRRTRIGQFHVDDATTIEQLNLIPHTRVVVN
jgi:tRNA pseudouridine55 synthase